jgi:hypothetical protein
MRNVLSTLALAALAASLLMLVRPRLVIRAGEWLVRSGQRLQRPSR